MTGYAHRNSMIACRNGGSARMVEAFRTMVVARP